MTQDHDQARQRIASGGPWEERVGYSRAVRVGAHVWVAGTTGTMPDGDIPAGAGAQARLALDVIERALAEAGATWGDVVMGRVYVVDFAEFDEVAAAWRERPGDVRPSLTAVQVAALYDPRHRVEIEVEAVVGSAAAG